MESSLSLPLFPPFVLVTGRNYTREEQQAIANYFNTLCSRFGTDGEGCYLKDQFTRRELSPMGQMHAVARFGTWARQFPIHSVQELFAVAALCGNLTIHLAWDTKHSWLTTLQRVDPEIINLNTIL